MQYYIQKLHDKEMEDLLVEYMERVFPDYDISYCYATKHAGYFTFRKNGEVSVEFIISSFSCYPFAMDSETLKSDLDERVRKKYLNFMIENFKEYEKEYGEFLSNNENVHQYKKF